MVVEFTRRPASERLQSIFFGYFARSTVNTPTSTGPFSSALDGTVISFLSDPTGLENCGGFPAADSSSITKG